jgi:hypothetical protein
VIILKGYITPCLRRRSTNKQFMNSGSCCVVDLEQWTGFKGAATGCLSYCHDTNLRGTKWSSEAGISTKAGRGRVTLPY